VGRYVVAVSLALVMTPAAAKEVDWSHRDQAVGFAGDFFHSTWKPGGAVLRGENPYPPPDSPALAGAETIYPPPLFVATAPLALLRFEIARILWTGALLAAVTLTLFALGVLDPRCYAVWLLSAPVVGGLMWGNATLVMILAAALVWRFRDRPYAVGVTLGAAIAVKLFLAPLLVWLLFTRRTKAALVAISIAVSAIFVSWAVIMFRGFGDYPELLSWTTELQLHRGLLVSALARHIGIGIDASIAVGIATAALFLVGSWVLRHDPERAYALALVAVLFATPIIHIFNLGLLAVAIAVLVPTFHWVWMALPLLWLSAFSGPFYGEGRLDLIVYSILLTASCALWLASLRVRREPPQDPTASPLTAA
jgi:alpha-1,2-mannosyltransferase